MTTPAGGNEVFRPTPIQFTETYDVTKMRRLAADVVNIANRLGSLSVATVSTALPTGGTVGQVLTILTGGTRGWANPVQPTTFPWSGLTGVPTSFPPSQHLIASPTALGPAHTIQAAAPGQVLKATGLSTARMDFLNYADLGDVNLAGLMDGFVPTWVAAAGQWQMKPAGTSFSGLTPGTVYTATSATTAQFLPLSASSFLNLIPGVAQYGVNPVTDTLLTGDGRWTEIWDLDINWAQISDVPSQVSNLAAGLSIKQAAAIASLRV